MSLKEAVRDDERAGAPQLWLVQPGDVSRETSFSPLAPKGGLQEGCVGGEKTL